MIKGDRRGRRKTFIQVQDHYQRDLEIETVAQRLSTKGTSVDRETFRSFRLFFPNGVADSNPSYTEWPED